MTFYKDIMPYLDKFKHVYGWNLRKLWYPLKIWTPKNLTIANFRHPVSKSWLSHCVHLMQYNWILSPLCNSQFPMTLYKDIIMPYYDWADPDSFLVKSYLINYSLPLFAVKHFPSLPHQCMLCRQWPVVGMWQKRVLPERYTSLPRSDHALTKYWPGTLPDTYSSITRLIRDTATLICFYMSRAPSHCILIWQVKCAHFCLGCPNSLAV